MAQRVRFVPFLAVGIGALVAVILAVVSSPGWWVLAAPLLALAGLGAWDVVQTRHSILRNYPVIAHLRYLAEDLRPELQQYFVEQANEGRPFDRDTRTLVYERAKGVAGEAAFGTNDDVYAIGRELVLHSIAPHQPQADPPRVTVGGPDCRRPYEMSLLNVSAMSFGSLSANAILALNGGARIGGFAHDTGEGGLTEYHLRPGGDLIWEIGSGYFGCRTASGGFDAELFRDKAAHESVKCVSLKLSQGAKPGIGGVMPAAKVTAEIASIRGVPEGVACVSPPAHQVFATPRELVEFIARFRELADGKPTGIKLCIGYRHEFLAICKAMLELGVTPDFIVVDGSEGGTGAAPQEFEDHVGLPLTDGLTFVHNALVGTGLRDRIRIGASGKVATGADMVKRMAQGADYCNSARAMMFALGCIQAQRCHTNTCPVGVATQDPKRARALEVNDKTQRVANYQQATVASAVKIMAAMAIDHPSQLHPAMITQRNTSGDLQTYEDLYQWLEPGELLAGGGRWAAWWQRADPARFGPA